MPTPGKLPHAVSPAVSVCLLLLFLFLIYHSARAGFASLLYTYAATSNEQAAAKAAVRLSPGDPEAHYLLGATFEAAGDLPAADAEYVEAIVRRPDDYVLWLALARGRELNGQPLMAITAAREATKLAPYYAQPHWQLGNMLVRAGQVEEGFAELRVAAGANPTLLPAGIDLAWQLSGGKVPYVMQAVQPSSPAAYLTLAEYFEKHDQLSDTIAMLRAAGSAADDFRRRYIAELLTAKRFGDAYAVWSIGHPPADQGGTASAIMSDPGFEQESDLDEPGFGWRADATVTKAQGAVLSLDPSNAQAGKSSLRIEFRGDSDPLAPLITQLVIATPNTHYHLKFVARTEEIVSGGLPLIAVTDAAGNVPLGTTQPLPHPNSNWQNFDLDFQTGPATNAIQIGLRRESCSKSPCPIFGLLWLDSFSLQKL
ncbi:MAG: hypothetical protein JWM21_4089 [Acidobacteria bacterium]|nr:hypothetical protein [Acidobacteriota bacterium]